MAIIVNQAPVNGQSAHFDLWHVVNTDLAGDPTLRCIFDVYINSQLITSDKVYPPPGIGTNGFKNMSPIVRNYFPNYFAPTANLISFQTNSIYLDYTVKYGEEYTTSGGNVVTLPNQQSSTHRVYNCYSNNLQAGSLNVMNGWDHKFLTERDPKQISIPADDSILIPYLKGTSTSAHTFVIWIRQGNTLVGSYSSGSVAANTLSKLIVFRISPAIMNALSAGSFPSNADNVILFVNDGNTTVQYEYKLTCKVKHKPVQLHFLNRLGGYETFSFNLVNREELTLDKQIYSTSGFYKSTTPVVIPPPDPSVFVGSSVNVNSTTKTYYSGQTQYATQQKYSYTLISNYINEQDYSWLKQLIASPIVYMSEGDYFYPVLVKDTKWTEKKSAADGMFNLELSVISFENLYSQYQ